jgi:hypothetical protein
VFYQLFEPNVVTPYTKSMSEAHGMTATAEPESSFDFAQLPHDELDRLVGEAAGIAVTGAQTDHDEIGRLGVRSNTPGRPALFRVGQIVDYTSVTGEVRRTYMGYDAMLHPLEVGDGTDLPPEVIEHQRHIAELEAERTRQKRRANSIDAADIGVTFEVQPPLAETQPPFTILRAAGVHRQDGPRHARAQRGRHRKH